MTHELATATSTTTVTEINDIEQLESLRLVWNALLGETTGASFFHTLDWLQAYWRHAGAGQRLRLLVVSSGHRPIGILPLTVIRESTRLGSLRVLTYPLHAWGTFFGPIGPHPTATLTLGLQHIRRTRRDWDLVDLRWVNRDEWDHHRTPWSLANAGLPARERIWDRTAMVDMSGTWEDYWSQRPKKFRQNVARQLRRLGEQGEVRHIRFRPAGAAVGDGDPRWDLYDQCLQVAERSWQGASETGTTICHDSVAGFFRETHALAAKNGMLDLNLLTIAGRPAAFSYNYHHQGRLTGMRVGFDSQYAQLGVGNALWHTVLKDSFERGDTLLDIGVGSLDIKQVWATRFQDSFQYTHYPLCVARAQLLRLKHWSVISGSRPDRSTDGSTRRTGDPSSVRHRPWVS